MAVKIRLTRVGRHKDPHYRIVATDSRQARDGRIIEQIGFYNPDHPQEQATINEELALKWLANGAQPSDTVRAIFKKTGILEKHRAAKKAGK
ncbi:MAG: 30S ribosomal protein S16 [Bacilli bacterium]|jgi:small subunit ribosomal protein S16